MAGSPQLVGAVDAFDAVSLGGLPFATVSNASELAAAISALNTLGLGGRIVANAGVYAITGQGPIVTASRVNIDGAGDQASIFDFTPTGHDQSAIKFDNGGVGGVIAQCSIKGFGFRSSDTTYRKIMIEYVDVQQFEVAHIASIGGAWTDASFLSEGIRSKGRQTVNIHDSTIYTDISLHVMQNPRFPGIDLDHCHFGPCLEVASTNGNPVIKVDANVVISSTTFRNMAWVGGGFGWAGTNLSASLHLKFEDIRAEQMQNGKWTIDINGTTSLQALTVDNVRTGGVTVNGVRLRHVTFVDLRQFFFVGGGVVLDVDSTVYNIVGDNCRAANPATASISGQVLVRADHNADETGPLPSPSFVYQSTSSANLTQIQQLGVIRRAYTGLLANNGQFNFAIGFSGAEKAIIVTVAARNTSTGADLGGVVTATGGATGTASCAAPTATFAAGNVPGKLTVLWQNQANIILLNQLGVDVDYVIELGIYK
jgi:hypothetical protein